jgi:hypothetical protein
MSLELDPSDVGLDPARLAGVSRFFDRYVEEGKLPGFRVSRTLKEGDM